MTLKALRKQSKKTAAEVAEVLGVSQWAIVKYESGNRKINIEQVKLLGRLYEVTAEEIIEAQLASCRRDQ